MRAENCGVWDRINKMSSNIRLFQAAGFEDCQYHVIEPWFRQKVHQSMRSERPMVVIVPTHAYAAYLKQKVVTIGLPILGIHFWSPGNLREFLFQSSKKSEAGAERLALGEDLHLLMAIAAGSSGIGGQGQEELLRRVLEERPGELARTMDQLKAAGHNSKSLNGEFWTQIFCKCEKLLAQTGILTIQEVDWRLAADENTYPKLIGSLLLTGFSARNWPLLPLLRAGCAYASEALVCLQMARESQAERLWIGTWEENYGEPELVPQAEPTENFSFSNLCLNFSMDLAGNPENAAAEFFLAANVREEADVITALACSYLSASDCERLVILAPPGSILGREVAARLARLGIPFLDNIGFYPAQSSRQSLLNRWIEFQRDQSLISFHLFLRLRRNLELDSPEFSRAAERDLKKAANILLSGNLDVLQSWLEEHLPQGEGAMILNNWPILSDRESFDGFVEASLESLEKLGWKSEMETLVNRAEPLKKALRGPIKRSIFLRWLGEILRTPGRTRHKCGRQSLSRLHLLTYEQAEGQSFSHVISGGLNHGLWPPESPISPYLSGDLLEALNRNSLTQGSQGEGHLIVKNNYGLLLSSRDLGQLSINAFGGLLESTQCRLAATASLAAEDDFSRPSLPSELFLKLYRADTGNQLDHRVMAELAAATRNWLHRFQPPYSQSVSMTATDSKRFSQAHNARRNKENPFGEFEFAFREPPSGGLRLSCKDWESVLTRPASVWINAVSRTRKPVDFNEPINWPLTMGTWIHEWLGLDKANAGEESFMRAFPKEGEWGKQVTDKAEMLQEAVRRTYQQVGRTLPDWWESGWSQALRLAGNLAATLDFLEGWPFAASEWNLPGKTEVDFGLPNTAALPVSGRIDLLLSKETIGFPKSGKPWAEGRPLWVIDFKSGRDRPLRPGDLQKGKGLQVALYALALHSLGAEDVSLSLLKPGDNLSNPLSLNDLISPELHRLWSGLCNLQQNGALGMIGMVRAKYGAAVDYPIATLPLDAELLRVKWEKTHPLLPYGSNF